MTSNISEAEFAVLLQQTGLPLSEQQRRTLYQAYPMVEEMAASVNRAMPRDAEPALIFEPEVG